MVERLLAPKDVARILGVGYEKAVLLMRSMRRINISTNPASCRPRYVVTESELTRWQKEKTKAPEILPMPVPTKKTKAHPFDEFAKYRNPDGTIKRERIRKA